MNLVVFFFLHGVSLTKKSIHIEINLKMIDFAPKPMNVRIGRMMVAHGISG